MKGKIITVVISFILISVIFSGLSEGGESNFVYGLCSSDGAKLISWNPERSLEILTDEVGAAGNYGGPGGFAYDVGNHFTGWENLETTRGMICDIIAGKGYSVQYDEILYSGTGVTEVAPPRELQMMSIPTASFGAGWVDVSWTASPDPACVGYLVYRSDVGGGAGYNLIGGTTSIESGYWAMDPVANLERATSWITNTTFEDHTYETFSNCQYAIRYVYGGEFFGNPMGIPTQMHDGSLGKPTTYWPVYSGYSESPVYTVYPDIELHESGNDILINWTEGSGLFEIWRSNNVDGTGFVYYDSTNAKSYTDVGALADNNSYSYYVHDVINNLDSNMGFKLCRQLTSNGLGNNWISLPYKCDITTADELMDDINADGPGGDAAYIATRWDTTNQIFQSRIDIGASRIGINFPLTSYTGYQVKMSQNVTWKIVGANHDLDNVVPVPLVNNSMANTWISLPYNSSLKTADDLIDNINSYGPGGDSAIKLVQWNSTIQVFQSRVDIGAVRIGINFPLVPGVGYLVKMGTAVNWEIF